MADLCTIADVKGYLNITGTSDDALLTLLVDRISRMIETHHDLKIALVIDLVEFYNGPGTDALVLRNYPVVAITTVHHDEERIFTDPDTLIDAADYFVDLERGMIFRNGRVPFFRGVPRNHRVKYNAGFATIPSDYVHAAVLMTARAFKEKDNILVTTQSLKDGSFTKNLSQFKFASMLKELLPHRARKI